MAGREMCVMEVALALIPFLLSDACTTSLTLLGRPHQLPPRLSAFTRILHASAYTSLHATRHVSYQAWRGECGVHDCPMCSCRRLPLYEGNVRLEYLPSSISTSQAMRSPKQAGVCIPRPMASRSQQTFALIYMSINEQKLGRPMIIRAVRSLPRMSDSQIPACLLLKHLWVRLLPCRRRSKVGPGHRPRQRSGSGTSTIRNGCA